MAQLPRAGSLNRAESLNSAEWETQFLEMYGKGLMDDEIFTNVGEEDLLGGPSSVLEVVAVGSGLPPTPPQAAGSKRPARALAGRQAKRARPNALESYNPHSIVPLRAFGDLADDGSYPRLSVEIAQGDASRMLSGGVAWLRANDRPTWFNMQVRSPPNPVRKKTSAVAAAAAKNCDSALRAVAN